MITVVILTKNSEKYLSATLGALKRFDEVVVYDTGSTDETVEIAALYPNVSVHRGEFNGFGPTRNVAAKLAKNDWILALDSDEVATPQLVEEILNLDLDGKKIFSVSRHNEYRGKWIRWCGWYPDRVFRLYNQTETQYGDAKVHESLIESGMVKVDLKQPLRHYPYASTEDFLNKMQKYSTLFAEQYKGKRSSSMTTAILHGSFAFFKSYFIKRGIFGGREGFEISLYNANTAFYKYMKLAEANQELDS